MRHRTPLLALAAAGATLAIAGTASADTGSFSNPTPIAPADRISNNDNPGVPDPFPSELAVNALSGSIADVDVTLHDVSTTFAADIDVLLVAPDGRTVKLISDAGAGTDTSHQDLGFDDSAATALSSSAITSGTYRPTDLDGGDPDSFPTGTEFPVAGSSLASLNGGEPTGRWRLLVVDDGIADLSTIAGGWSLTVRTTAGKVIEEGGEVAIEDRASAGSEPGGSTPTTLTATDVDGVIDHVTVTLQGVQSTDLRDLDVLLVGPNGRRVILMSDVPPGFVPDDRSVTLQQTALFGLPGLLPSLATLADAWQPTNNSPIGEPGGDVFPSPAPTGPYEGSLEAFEGISPNGAWRLFAADDTSNESVSTLNGGWRLNFTLKPSPSAPSTEPAPTQQQPPPAPPANEPPKADTAPLAISGLKLKPERFRARKGTTIRYTLSAGARVRFIVRRRVDGRFKRLRGRLAQDGHAGANKRRLRKLAGHRLKPGRYLLTAKATGARTRTARFEVVR